MRIALIVMMALACLASPVAAQDGWRPLFNGRTLDGWYQCNGTAPYSVEEGVIVGRTVVGSPNSFLCSKESFGDFVLEYEVWVDTNFNSGMQIRSIADPAIKNGRMHGLQVEVDPSERAWSGGIYDEARRGWLHTLTGQETAQKAFRLKEWNRFRIEAIGTSIRTWINGVPCADILDDLTMKGVFGIQVHSIGNDASRAGRLVKFRTSASSRPTSPQIERPPRATPRSTTTSRTRSPSARRRKAGSCCGTARRLPAGAARS